MSGKTTTSSNGEKDKDSAKPKQTVTVFPDIENAEAPIQLSRETTHSNHHVYIAPDNLTLRGTKGYCQAKCNNGVTEGRWYYEVELKNMGPQDNARIGWSMISSLLTGPCGFDLFSFSYRARTGMLYHDSRPRSPPTVDDLAQFVKGYGPGDVLGVEIYLPKPSDQQQSILDSRVWRPKARSSYEAFKVPLPLPKAGPQSEIRYYVNGQLLGTAFSDLYLGKYHPAFSLFRDAEATVNFGPAFKFPPAHLVTEADPHTCPCILFIILFHRPSDHIPSADPSLQTNTIAPHPTSFFTSLSTSTQPSSETAGNPPSTPSRAAPPPPLTLLAPEPDRPESASQRHQAWVLMHAHGRAFPYYRVRDIIPGKHYVDKSGSRVSTKVQVASPTSPFRSAATKSAGEVRSHAATTSVAAAAAARPESDGEQGAVVHGDGMPISPMSPIGASKRRRTMGGGAAPGIMSPTLGGGGAAHSVGEMATLVLPPMLPVQVEHRFMPASHQDEDVEMPDAKSTEAGAGERAGGGVGVGVVVGTGENRDGLAGDMFRDSPLA
ncbi:concanavalin A-like lectin/glucanase domain-containing protein [Catenaria anguillulae PL171]|uniref:Concanavalin A-like lectin/glucanase domain-containing protein n=1 Tax=Catenaria anguillulae PL171 TaxID=765915 RepID=A0A1Y2HSP9_9FUNG|nr:concanavalin A-like lectin/glucanase domain-containing protein [Catenaria anguillulae PL171]